MDHQLVPTLHRKDDSHVHTRKDIKRKKNEHSENLANRFQEYAGALSCGKVRVVSHIDMTCLLTL